METKPTAGPHYMEPSNVDGEFLIYSEEHDTLDGVLATVHASDREGAAKANANLFAGALRVVEAAETLLAARDKTNESLRDALRKAIASARGV